MLNFKGLFAFTNMEIIIINCDYNITSSRVNNDCITSLWN